MLINIGSVFDSYFTKNSELESINCVPHIASFSHVITYFQMVKSNFYSGYNVKMSSDLEQLIKITMPKHIYFCHNYSHHVN